jgi:hypothetical protein
MDNIPNTPIHTGSREIGMFERPLLAKTAGPLMPGIQSRLQFSSSMTSSNQNLASEGLKETGGHSNSYRNMLVTI